MSQAWVASSCSFSEDILVSSVRSVKSTDYLLQSIIIDHPVSEVVLCPSRIILYLFCETFVYAVAMSLVIDQIALGFSLSKYGLAQHA